MNLPEHIVWRIAKTEYVVVVRDRKQSKSFLNLVIDPSDGKPWHSQNKLRAEDVAKDCDGGVFTLEEAFKLLIKENVGSEVAFEKMLVDRVAQQANIVRGTVTQDAFKKGQPTKYDLQ